jgi:DNA-binding transcriptional ArsR family regulator
MPATSSKRSTRSSPRSRIPRGGSATAGEIAGRFAHKWPTTTRHLHVLQEAGLVREERQGRNRVYTVDRERLALVREWLDWFDR